MGSNAPFSSGHLGLSRPINAYTWLFMAIHSPPWPSLAESNKAVTCWQMHGLGVFQGVVLACSKNGLFMGQIGYIYIRRHQEKSCHQKT